MKTQFASIRILSVALCALLSTITTSAALRYVWQDSPGPEPPYDSWATAATDIQDAIDAADPSDTVLVAGGIYDTGGRAVEGTMTNRVVINKAITVQSLMGPEVTLIVGAAAPGGGNGDGAIRCVYLAANAVLSGFTLTNGHTRKWDGDEEHEARGGGVWSESTAMATNCVIVGNSAQDTGGGACGGTLNNCTLTRNSAMNEGGGAYGGTLNNCAITENSSWETGGGADSSTLNNCTLIGNYGDEGGGGASWSTLNNCIVYYNTEAWWAGGESDYYRSTLNYCCTTPLPTNGVDNITAQPLLASASHLSAASPCRGAGGAAYATGTDVDGEPWSSPPSIGCDEYRIDSVTGPLNVGIVVSSTNVAVGYTLDFRVLIEGRTSASVWAFGDGMTLSNRPYAAHAWAAPGQYAVVLTAYNESNPGGVTATGRVQVLEVPQHYVAADSATPMAPYDSWATAARTIQEAVDVAGPGAVVLVTNGVYSTGGRAAGDAGISRVVVNKPIALRSVNGPEFTVIEGYQVPGTTNGDGAVRCAYLEAVPEGARPIMVRLRALGTAVKRPDFASMRQNRRL